MSKYDLNKELSQLETQLASFRPRPSRVDQDRVMFLAGQASIPDPPPSYCIGPIRKWAWPASFGAVAAVACALLVILFTRPESPVVERFVYVQVSSSDVRASQQPSPWTGAADVTSNRATNLVGLAYSGPALRDGLPAAGLEFRLFDHLLAESSYRQAVWGMSSGNSDAPRNKQILSAGSLDELLDHPADIPSDLPPSSASQQSGANS